MRPALLDALLAHGESPGCTDAERPALGRLVELVRDEPRCFERSLARGHVTGSAWVLDAERKARQKVVRTGPRGGAGIVIVDGIGPDDEVVVEGTQRLFDGAQTFDPKAVPAP